MPTVVLARNEAECAGCGALVPANAGPTHAYIPASPGCWSLYASLEDWKAGLTEPSSATTVQKLVDLYAVQHATNRDRRNRQSVAVHLMSLCSSIERGELGGSLRALLGTWTHREYPLLEPPRRFAVTVRTIADAATAERRRVIAAGAESTWHEWAAHHTTIREWLDQAPPMTPRRRPR